jgi:hypothetical protein
MRRGSTLFDTVGDGWLVRVALVDGETGISGVEVTAVVRLAVAADVGSAEGLGETIAADSLAVNDGERVARELELTVGEGERHPGRGRGTLSDMAVSCVSTSTRSQADPSPMEAPLVRKPQ